MKVVVQRVLKSSVSIDGSIYSSIDNGLLIFVGFTYGDNIKNIDKMVNKIINLRIFEDSNKKLNLSIKDIKGSIMSISQFTLYADTKRGNRPSFKDALEYESAKELYDIFNQKLSEEIPNLKTGIFGSDMKVELLNDGPITIIMEEN